MEIDMVKKKITW